MCVIPWVKKVDTSSFACSIYAQNGLTCPTCKKVYGMKTGDMPDGNMNVRHTRHSLPGYERYGTIEIVYSFSPGIYVSNCLLCD